MQSSFFFGDSVAQKQGSPGFDTPGLKPEDPNKGVLSGYADLP